jgi:hypothetical protein
VPDSHVTREEFNRLDKQVNGNGQPGLKQDLATCVSQLDAIRGAQDERAKIDSRRWTAMTLILSLLTFLLGLLTYLEGNRQAHSGWFLWPEIPHKSLAEPKKPEYADSQTQDAAGDFSSGH